MPIEEHEIARAIRDLARIGRYAEPTSATAAAAVDVLRTSGVIAPGERTVVVLTGSDLKAATTISTLLCP
ncbi:hypothetical protein GCM10022222_53640 [Amycolatopsis ultiminotia]|uniref:Threonine synthase n=1 Tax=Amycolatopsis ultiminotia TaxID=543629 RepID=A0ABP6X9G4_9PSEU